MGAVSGAAAGAAIGSVTGNVGDDAAIGAINGVIRDVEHLEMLKNKTSITIFRLQVILKKSIN